jgi:lysosomal acid lipase/cholesteryl ester hydrolase
MVSIVVSFISTVLLCITATHGRKTLYTTKEFSASSPVINDGICKTMVETQGYTCEEHKVNISNMQVQIKICVRNAMTSDL